MLKLFQKLSKNLSIKSIVLLGVYIMALIILAFTLTMSYLFSTIKSDQDTLKDILNLERKNQTIISTIKNINDLDTKILVVDEVRSLDELEDRLLKQLSFDKLEKNEDNELFNNYNKEIEKSIELLNIRIALQEKAYESKAIILFYNEEINAYKISLQEQITDIENQTESIYGKASLLTKRYNRKIKRGVVKPKEIQELSLQLSRIMTISKDLDSSILKLPTYLNNINSTNNEDVINSIYSNNLSQLISLFEDSLIKIESIEYSTEYLQSSVEKINLDFTKVKELITFIVTARKQVLKEQVKFQSIEKQAQELNLKIFDSVAVLDEISNKIKFGVLNHSDNISKKTTYIILAVGMVLFVSIFFAALTLISRINLPLEFMIRYIDGIITQKKDLNAKLPILTEDEFGKLSHSFNNMTSTISSNINEIESLYKEIEDTQKEVIFTMGSIGESRSKETGNHVKRVAEYSKILALKIGLDIKEAELLKEASPMHDIGKVGIPDSILKKPEQLNEKEWEVMKTHATLGYDMLKHSNRDILKAAAIVAHEHHEKWDGSGYPRGLVGDHIHIYGRITAVADVFDALASDRCYKKAWEMDAIIEFFKQKRAKHFDPKLTDLFLDNIHEFIYVRDKYKDVFD